MGERAEDEGEREPDRDDVDETGVVMHSGSQNK
ncbi:hypothetical protein NB689_000551 [Xanthomonas sacchari]|nr:hypothetical protein [Xanthomonas sacchari]